MFRDRALSEIKYVKMGHRKWALIQHDGYLYKKKKFGHGHIQRMTQRHRENPAVYRVR